MVECCGKFADLVAQSEVIGQSLHICLVYISHVWFKLFFCRLRVYNDMPFIGACGGPVIR